MNRYAAAGLTADALAGKRIVVLSPTSGMAYDAMDTVVRTLDDADPDTFRVRRANGEERIEFLSGGRIRFQSARFSLRGMSADVVFIDADRVLSATHRADLHTDLREVTGPVGGEVIRA